MSREIAIWIDERWYDALSKHLKDETLEEHLEGVIDEMCNQLPRQEYERISTLIWQEEQRSKEAAEAGRRFAVFHVTEHGESVHFLVEENLEMLQAAVKLRSYLRKPPEDSPAQFLGMFSRGERISAEQFDTYVNERLDNTGRVTGAFDIDLDNGTFDALHIMDGWQRFRIQDISTAAYYAMKKSYASWENRWKVFLDRLDGKQFTFETEALYLRGQRELCSRDIYFSDEIVQNDHLLEFYMDVTFDADAVFGTQVCTSENDDFLNIYANYDLERGCVCDTLDVYLVRGDSSEQDYKYRLSEEEQAFLLPKMEEYCKEQFGCGLDELRSQYLSEQTGSQQSPQM
ncbi:MAG: hypothetical protein K1W04_07255 [Oscillospiraceae bacterium]